MTPDWWDGSLRHSFRVELVDPVNLTTSRGQLQGVASDGTVSESYYSDARATAGLKTYVASGEEDGWDGTAAMRVVHMVGDWEESLFTGYVTKASRSEENGLVTREYTLTACIYGMSTQILAGPYTVGAGAMGLAVLEDIFGKCVSRRHRVMAGATDYRFGTATVYEPGKSWLSMAMDVANRSGDRLEAGGDGYVEVERYVVPSSRDASFSIDPWDSRSIVTGELKYSDSATSVPGRAIVYAESDGQALNYIASQTRGSRFHYLSRGFVIDDFQKVTDLSPFSRDRARQVAEQALADATDVGESLTMGTLYLPARPGEVIRVTSGEVSGRWMISTRKVDMSNFTCEYGMKKVGE